MADMLYYTYGGEQVKEDDPRADYQVNPNTPEDEKNKLIEANKKLSPFAAPHKERPSTLEHPNLGVGDEVNGVAITARPAITAKEAKPVTNDAPKPTRS